MLILVTLRKLKLALKHSNKRLDMQSVKELRKAEKMKVKFVLL